MELHKDILPNHFQDEKLYSFYDGSMEMGLKIGCDLDKHYVWKPAELNIGLGADGVGKTFWKLWYFVCLAKKHGKKGCIYAQENQLWSVKMKLMSFYSGKHLTKLTESGYFEAKIWVEAHFTIIDNRKFYVIDQLLDVILASKADYGLIDPYNALDLPDGVNEHLNNKKNLGKCRQFVNQTQITLDINAHPASGRTRTQHKSGEFEGMITPPVKADIEGGQIFPNRTDNFYIFHRYNKIPWKNITFLYVEKIKEEETGGSKTDHGEPLMFEFEEYGFRVNGVDPMTGEMFVTDHMHDVINPQGGMDNFNSIEDIEKDLF